MFKKIHSKKGFTLAELLIVVAIIAVLTAIAIPVFSGQLAKAEQATDLANVRSVYAEQVATQMSENSDISIPLATLQAAATKSTVSYASNTITVTHNTKTSITGSFSVDSDVTITG